MIRRTLARAVERRSVGVHSGADCALRLVPAAFGAGVTFVAGGERIPADVAHARAEPGCTALVGTRARVGTPEHLLAALDALGVTDVDVEVDGGEVPILDGSAREWVDAIDEAGRVDGPELAADDVRGEVRVEEAGGVAVLGPGDAVAVEVDFGAGGPAGSLRVPRSEAAFRDEIAWARTFVRRSEIEALRASGRGRGASAENTVVWPDGPFRAPDEVVRHKLLDAWGDLALRGPGRAELRVARGSHHLHLAVLVAEGLTLR